VLRELERSGLSMAEFCRRRGLAYGTVAGWRGAARRETPRFVEVEMDVERPSESGAPPPVMESNSLPSMELRLPGGTVLLIYQAQSQGGAV
jgi:hypothetical protein